jgi:hypothetical protein
VKRKKRKIGNRKPEKQARLSIPTARIKKTVQYARKASSIFQDKIYHGPE